MTETEKMQFLITAIKELFNKTIPVLSIDDSFSKLGLDSLDTVELQMYYEDKNGVETKDSSKPIKTIGDLLELMP
jgi:acyl carrier protein